MMAAFNKRGTCRIPFIAINVVWPLLFSLHASAGLVSWNPFEISFGKPAGQSLGFVASRASTVVGDGLMLAPNGAGWVESDAICTSLSYRPACSMTVSFDVTLEDDSDKWELTPQLRYGCDRVHWSEWEGPAGAPGMTITPTPIFLSRLRVPQSECEKFSELVKDVEQPAKDTVWGQEAYFRWIAERTPEVFAQTIPTIGYIQIRVVNKGGRPVKIKSINGNIHTYVSGLHRSDEPFDMHTNWHFDLRPAGATTDSHSDPGTIQAGAMSFDFTGAGAWIFALLVLLFLVVRGRRTKHKVDAN